MYLKRSKPSITKIAAKKQGIISTFYYGFQNLKLKIFMISLGRCSKISFIYEIFTTTLPLHLKIYLSLHFSSYCIIYINQLNFSNIYVSSFFFFFLQILLQKIYNIYCKFEGSYIIFSCNFVEKFAKISL